MYFKVKHSFFKFHSLLNNYKGKNQMKNIILATIVILFLGVIGCSEPNGPEGDGFWEHIRGLTSATSIAVASNGDIWIGTFNPETLLYGIYLSTNNGNTWAKKDKGVFTNSIYSIAINPINSYIFAGTESKGLFRSTDNGESWLQLTNHLEVREIFITASGGMYWGMRGIYYSSNNVNDWIDKSTVLPANHKASYFTSFAMGKDGTLYVGTSDGVYRSTDGGDTWLLPSNYIDDVYIRGVTISSDGSIFAATAHKGVLKSTNGGDTWTQVNNGLAIENTYKIMYNPITDDIFVSTSVHDSKYHYRVYRSTNLGVSWELTNALSANGGFAFNPNTGQMFASGSDGVYRSKK
jgi:photosystem II stability/assembly factor-like uncharacterized protein